MSIWTCIQTILVRNMFPYRQTGQNERSPCSPVSCPGKVVEGRGARVASSWRVGFAVKETRLVILVIQSKIITQIIQCRTLSYRGADLLHNSRYIFSYFLPLLWRGVVFVSVALFDFCLLASWKQVKMLSLFFLLIKNLTHALSNSCCLCKVSKYSQNINIPTGTWRDLDFFFLGSSAPSSSCCCCVDEITKNRGKYRVSFWDTLLYK